MFKKILIVCLSIFILSCLTGCGIDKTIYYVEMEDEKIVEYTYKELKKIYEENEVSWEKNYADRYVKFTSKVKKIEMDSWGLGYIIFEHDVSGSVEEDSVLELKLESLKKGSKLTCTGYLRTSDPFYVDLVNCV